MYFTCVHPSARGQGVMKGLWKSTIDVAREHGYATITAQAGSEAVRQVLAEHLGFTEMAAVKYNDFEFEGNRVFAELPLHDPVQYSRISIHKRSVPSNLYV
jgi:GNAT superfamily N-acetyltransferase